jgi:hypothetical protein
MRLPPSGELMQRARMLTGEEIDTVMWFCVSCCGLSTWKAYAKLIMRCEREEETLSTIKDWHSCQHGKERDYQVIKYVQEKVFPIIQEYKYAKYS